VMNIAYYFDFGYTEPRRAEEYADEVRALCAGWQSDQHRGDLEITVAPDGRLQILDTRAELAKRPRRALLDGWKAAVYVACDRAAPLARLRELPAVTEHGVPQADLVEFLRRCVHYRLMVTNDTRWLGVAVWRERDRQRWADETGHSSKAASTSSDRSTLVQTFCTSSLSSSTSTSLNTLRAPSTSTGTLTDGWKPASAES